MNKTTHFPKDDKKIALQVDHKNNPAILPTPSRVKWLPLGAVAGPILFTLAWFILGFLSPGFTLWDTVVSPYSPISQSISGLGLGTTALPMNTAFVLSGLLVVAGAVGIFLSMDELNNVSRWICITLLALSGLGLVIDGIFTLESIMPHTIGFLLGTGTPVVSFLVIGILFRRIPQMRSFGTWLILASPLTLVLLVLYFVTFDPATSGEGLGVAGLTQRILVVEVHSWLVALGWLVFRRSQLPHSSGDRCADDAGRSKYAI